MRIKESVPNPYDTPDTAVARMHGAVVLFDRISKATRVKDLTLTDGSVRESVDLGGGKLLVKAYAELRGIQNAGMNVLAAMSEHLGDHAEAHPKGTIILANALTSAVAPRVR